MDTNIIVRLLMYTLTNTTALIIISSYLFKNYQIMLMIFIISASSLLLYLIRSLEYNLNDKNYVLMNILKNNMYKIEEKLDECIICFNDEIYFIKFNCNHYYCRNCIINGDFKLCPICRKLINYYDIKYIINTK